MMDEFNGRLNMEWIPVTERMPLEEYDTNAVGMIAYVLALVVNLNDRNDDPTVVSILYQAANHPDDTGWFWEVGDPYPEQHAKNIRYWTYHPHYRTKDILEYEKLRPFHKFCAGKKSLDTPNKI